MADTTATPPITADDDDIDDAPDVAGFDGALQCTAFRRDDQGNRTEQVVCLGLRVGVYASGAGSMEFLHPTTGHGVSMYLPEPVARQMCGAIFDREWLDVS